MLRGHVFGCVLCITAAGAQSFEAASIKPSPPPGGGPQFTGIATPGGGRLNTSRTSLRMLITFAYSVRDSQLSGGPGWANSAPYDITAKAEENAALPQLKRMLQTLLKERFKLDLQREAKLGPIYELVVAKGGPKLSEDTTSPGLVMAMTGRGVIAKKASLANLVQFLGSIAGRPVVDKTGLASTYAFHLEWSPDAGEGGPPGPRGPDVVASDPSGPSLYTALQEQLGLRLQSANGPVESLTIVAAERPSQN